MPIPDSLDDLSPVETLNSPQGGDQVGGNVDNYFRAHATIMKRDLAPALTAEGTKVTPAGNITATNAQAALLELDTDIGAVYTNSGAQLAAHKTSADHDTRYYTKGQVDASLSGKQPAGSYVVNGTPGAGSITLGWNGNVYVTVGSNVWTMWTSQNFNPGSKTNVGAAVVFNSGSTEFGPVDLLSPGGSAVDLPDNWVMTGLRYAKTSGTDEKLFIRGRLLKTS